MSNACACFALVIGIYLTFEYSLVDTSIGCFAKIDLLFPT